MTTSNPAHPIWATLRFFGLVAAVTLVLYTNASEFDETEIRAILEIAVLAGGFEGMQSYAARGKGE